MKSIASHPGLAVGVVAELHELDVLDLDIVREELSQRKAGKPAAVVAEIGNVADVIPHAAGDIDDELHIHRL